MTDVFSMCHKIVMCVIKIQETHHPVSFSKRKKCLLLWLCWVFVAAVATLQLQCMGFPLWWLFLLGNMGSRARGL